MTVASFPTGPPLALPWRVLPDYACFGCSPHNRQGLRLTFHEVIDGLECWFRVSERFESYPGVVHGGVTTAVCDETMGNLLVLRTGLPVFTTTLRMRYVEPLTIGAEYRCLARCDDAAPASWTAGTKSVPAAKPLTAMADVLDAGGRLVVSCSASYQPVTLEDARSRMDLSHDEAQVLSVALDQFGRQARQPRQPHDHQEEA